MSRILNVPHYKEKFEKLITILENNRISEFQFKDVKSIINKKEFTKFVNHGLIEKKMEHKNGFPVPKRDGNNCRVYCINYSIVKKKFKDKMIKILESTKK